MSSLRERLANAASAYTNFMRGPTVQRRLVFANGRFMISCLFF
jgi:hypothetical protein